MNNRVYLEMLEVCGKIDMNSFEKDRDIIDDMKNTNIDLRRMIEIYYKSKVFLFEIAYFALCRDLGKLLDRDIIKERSKEFFDKVCDRIERRYDILGRRKISDFLVRVRKLIDMSDDKYINYDAMEKYLKYMKIEKLPDGSNLKIGGKKYRITQENEDSITFMLENITEKTEIENISFLSISKNNKINCICEDNLKKKELKIKRSLENDEIDMVVMLDNNSNNQILDKIKDDYSA